MSPSGLVPSLSNQPDEDIGLHLNGYASFCLKKASVRDHDSSAASLS